MRAVIQRVSRASVSVDGAVAGQIERGLVVLLAVGREDAPATAISFAEKIIHLRIFNDDQGKMNRSLLDTGGSILAISQFTLYGDARGQRRPSFLQAAPPDKAQALSTKNSCAPFERSGSPPQREYFKRTCPSNL